MIRRIPCTVCRTSGSTPVNFLLQCSCGISLHHKCVVPAISQEVLLSMVEASINDRHANSLQTWQCPNCKTFEVSAKTEKALQSRFRTFASSSNVQIDEAYRHMLLKRPIESVYDHVHGMTAVCVNKKSKGAHTHGKRVTRDAKKVKYPATTRNPEPPSADLQGEIFKNFPPSGGDNFLPTESRKATTRTVKSPKLLPSTPGNKQGTKLLSDPPPMNVATGVQPQSESTDIHVQVEKATDSHHEVRPPTADDNTNQTADLNQDKAKELPLPPLLNLSKFLNTKLLPKRRHNTLRPTSPDQGAPPAKRRRLVYHATVPDAQTDAQTDDKRPDNDDAITSLLSANDNNDLVPVQSPSPSRQSEAPGNPIVTTPNKDTAQETSISSRAPPEQPPLPVESLESSHQTHTTTTQPLFIRTPSPTPPCPTAAVPSPAIIPTAALPSSPAKTKTPKRDRQDDPILNAQLDGAEGAASLKNDNIAQPSNVKSSTPNAPLPILPLTNSAINHERPLEDLALDISSDTRTGVEDEASDTNEPKFAILPDSSESVPDNVLSKTIDKHFGAADSILEVDQGSEDVTEIEAQDTPILLSSTNNCELEKKDTHLESSFADGLLSPPPTDDETQQLVASEPPSITKPDNEHISNGSGRNLKHTSDQGKEEVSFVGKIELPSSLDNIIKRLPLAQPKANSSFRLSTVTVPGLAKCFKSFGLSRRAC